MTDPSVRPRTAAANDASGDETATRRRNAEACEANRKKGTLTRIRMFLERVDELEARDLLAVTERLLVECEERGLPIPEL